MENYGRNGVKRGVEIGNFVGTKCDRLAGGGRFGDLPTGHPYERATAIFSGHFERSI